MSALAYQDLEAAAEDYVGCDVSIEPLLYEPLDEPLEYETTKYV